MKNRIASALKAVALVLPLTLAQAHAAQAPEIKAIKVLCSTVLKTVMQELVPQFERATGHTS